MPIQTPPIMDEINELVMALYTEYASHEPDETQIQAAFDALWDYIDTGAVAVIPGGNNITFNQRFRRPGRKIEIELTARILWDGGDHA